MADDRRFVAQSILDEIIILQQYQETAAMLLFPNLERKVFVVGDSHVKRIKRLDFNTELSSGNAFSRAVVRPFHLVVQTSNSFIALLYLLF